VAGAPRTEESTEERVASSPRMPEIPDLDLDPRIAGPPTERSRHITPLPTPPSRRPRQTLTADAERTEGAPAARRRSRRIVKPQDDSAPTSGDRIAAGDRVAAGEVSDVASRPAPLKDVQDDEWPIDSSPSPPIPILEEARPASKLAAPPSMSELLSPRSVPRPLASSVPRPSPKMSSSLPPPPVSAAGGVVAEADSVAVIRPIQILSIESSLPPVASLAEAAQPPPAETGVPEWTPLAFRILADEHPGGSPAAVLDAPQENAPEGPPTTRDSAFDAVKTGPLAAQEVTELDEEPESAPESLGGEAASVSQPPRSNSTDVELVELESAERSTMPPRSGDLELVEVDPERDADVSDEIAVDMVAVPASHPKKPPPPPPRRPRAHAMASPDLGSFAPPVPPATPSAPGVSQLDSTPLVRSPSSVPPPPLAPPVATPPAAQSSPVQRAPDPEPSSAPSTEPAPRRKRPWWEELFGDDFVRTLDRIEDKVVRREVDFIEERLGVEKGAVILDLACGYGMHAIEIASRGYSVVGYDLSLAMLARAADEAQDRGQKLNFLQGDMREMNFEETFDGIYCWSTSFGYFDDEKNQDVLSRIHRALRTGGMLLLDIVNRDYVSCRQPSLVWFEGDGCVCMDEMQVDFFTSRLKVKRTVMFEDGRSRELDYSLRLYGLHELGKMLHEAGFKVTEVTGHPAHPGVFFGSESPRLIILAERS
jgi:SAM-dependent methyltransferase